MKFVNVYYIVEDKTYVGNIELKSDKIVFKDDKLSINDEPCEIEILISEINKKELEKYIMGENRSKIIIIETKNRKYEFQFNFCGEYEEFISIVKSNILA